MHARWVRRGVRFLWPGSRGQRLYKVQFVLSQHGRLEVANFVASTDEEAIANFIQEISFLREAVSPQLSARVLHLVRDDDEGDQEVIYTDVAALDRAGRPIAAAAEALVPAAVGVLSLCCCPVTPLPC